MNSLQNALLDTLVTLWNWPGCERTLPYADLDFCRNPAVSPRTVLSVLCKSFSNSDIQTTISFFLQDVIATYRRNDEPTPRQLFLCDCCLMLLTMEGGYHCCSCGLSCDVPLPLHISKDIVKGAVETLPAVGWYTQLGALIKHYLSESEVLDALAAGLSTHRPLYIIVSLLEGIRLYYGRASKDYDTAQLERAENKLRSVIELLTLSSDPTIRNESRKALGYLDRYQ